MAQIIGIIIGFVLGFFSCWLFWRYQLTIKPSFEVSPKVASRTNPKYNTKKIYQIKIINLSLRPIINIRAKAAIQELKLYPNGHKRPTIYNIEFSKAGEAVLGPRMKKIDPWSITNIHYYTARPDKILEDLFVNEQRKLVLTIQATDAISSTTIIKRYTYGKEDFIEGKFAPGERMEIVPFNPD